MILKSQRHSFKLVNHINNNSVKLSGKPLQVKQFQANDLLSNRHKFKVFYFMAGMVVVCEWVFMGYRRDVLGVFGRSEQSEDYKRNCA